MFGNNVPVDGVHVLRGVCRLVVVGCRVLGASRTRSCSSTARTRVAVSVLREDQSRENKMARPGVCGLP